MEQIRNQLFHVKPITCFKIINFKIKTVHNSV